MGKMIKYWVLLLIGVVVVSLIALFLRPSIVLNKGNLVRGLNALNKSATVSYDELSFDVSSPSVFEKQIKLAAKNFCIKNKALDACLPDVAIDFILAVRFDEIKIVSIRQFVVDNGKILVLSKSKPAAPLSVATQTSNNDQPSIVSSVLLRIYNLLADLPRQNINDLRIKNLSYVINFANTPSKGNLNLENGPQAVIFKVDNYFKDSHLSILGSFNDSTQIKIIFEGDELIDFSAQANAFIEFSEYTKCKELYRYKTKNIQAKLNIKDVGSVLKMLNLYLYPRHIDMNLSGKIDSDIMLNLNYPKIDDFSLNFNLTGDLLDNGANINFAGDIVYYFYQKIPMVDITSLKVSGAKSKVVDSYNTYKIASYLANKLDSQIKYRWEDNKLKVAITRDYSKLPKKMY